MKLFIYAERLIGCSVLLLGLYGPHLSQLARVAMAEPQTLQLRSTEYVVSNRGQRIYPLFAVEDVCTAINQCLSSAAEDQSVDCVLAFGGVHRCSTGILIPPRGTVCTPEWDGKLSVANCR